MPKTWLKDIRDHVNITEYVSLALSVCVTNVQPHGRGFLLYSVVKTSLPVNICI